MVWRFLLPKSQKLKQREKVCLENKSFEDMHVSKIMFRKRTSKNLCFENACLMSQKGMSKMYVLKTYVLEMHVSKPKVAIWIQKNFLIVISRSTKFAHKTFKKVIGGVYKHLFCPERRFFCFASNLQSFLLLLFVFW